MVTSLVALDLASDLIVASPDMVRGAPLQRSPKASKFVASYARFFCNMALQANRFQTVAPTLLCSAVIRATRELLNVAPAWPPRLSRFTGYGDGELSRLARDLRPIIGASSRSTTRPSGPSPRLPNPCWTSRGRSSSRLFGSWTWTGTRA